jgi:hypothetical protein
VPIVTTRMVDERFQQGQQEIIGVIDDLIAENPERK